MTALCGCVPRRTHRRHVAEDKLRLQLRRESRLAKTERFCDRAEKESRVCVAKVRESIKGNYNISPLILKMEILI